MGSKQTRTATDFGTKIRRLRTKKGLSLEDLAAKTGLEPDYLARIEALEEIPPVAAILQIAKALSLDAGGLLETGGRKREERKKEEAYEKRTRSYAYRALPPGAGTKHLRAFLVSIDPHKDHDMVEYRHEGEEFIYVLEGKLELTVGSALHVLSAGESVHFNSGIRHMLRNPAGKKTRLLVVLYTP